VHRGKPNKIDPNDRFAMKPEAMVLDTQLSRPVWPLALLIVGLGATAAWTGLLGYGVIALVEMAL
jgi:hypothetical protein